MQKLWSPNDLEKILVQKLERHQGMFRSLSTKSKNSMILLPILGDQITLDNPALKSTAPSEAIVLMVEALDEQLHVSSTRMRSAVFLSAMRHFEKTLSSRGWTVRYMKLGEHAHRTLSEAWLAAIQELKPSVLRVCEPGDWRIMQALRSVAAESKVALEMLADDHFIVSKADFANWAGRSRQLRMEFFYRKVRKQEVILMNGDEPVGGQWNFDKENRKSFPKTGPKNLEAPLRFPIDAITQGVIADLEKALPNQPGESESFAWPVTRENALLALDDFIAHRLLSFGPTQDAMWTHEPFLSHSLLSVAMNLKLLSPREVIAAAINAYQTGRIGLASVEGFIRQILGWREFMRGVYWLDMPGMKQANHFGFTRSLPYWYWTGETNMYCMKQAISQTLKHGYAHHIQRLMITGNFALLAGIVPQEVSDWYLAVYVDAVEWVELPNTAGMALFANGGRFTSKPYIASGAYVKRMSNYCGGCRYNPQQKTGPDACPMTTLYWAFLDSHQVEMDKNPRAALMMKQLLRLDPTEREAIRIKAGEILSDLSKV
jgi:deoxyribodipyrimidine photolyase-related protein